MSKNADILHRLKIARGHLDKVISMVENDEYCVDVIHQSQAIQSALKKTDHMLLEKHLATCVVDHMKKGEITQSINEVMAIVKKTT